MLQPGRALGHLGLVLDQIGDAADPEADVLVEFRHDLVPAPQALDHQRQFAWIATLLADPAPVARRLLAGDRPLLAHHPARSEEHTSELQSLMRISYAVLCLKKKHE